MPRGSSPDDEKPNSCEVSVCDIVVVVSKWLVFTMALSLCFPSIEFLGDLGDALSRLAWTVNDKTSLIINH